MALVVSDRIKETTTTTGTGTYTLGGAVTGFETFTANLSNGDTTYYACSDGTDFEVGLGTFTSSGTTLARTTILASSNSNNAVSWSSGTRTIFCTLPAAKAVFLDGSGDLTLVGNTDNIQFDKSNNALEFKDSMKAIFGTGEDFIIFHDGSNTILRENQANPLFLQTNDTIHLTKNLNSETMAKFIGDGAVELYHDNSLRFTTTSTGAKVTGGAGDGTLIIEADTDNATEEDNALLQLTQDGGLVTVDFGFDANNNILIKGNSSTQNLYLQHGSEYFAIGRADGAFELYHDNSKKFETTSSGATVTGTLAATLSTAAQSNITSVGTLTGLTTSGTINLSQTSGAAIKTTGDLSAADLTLLRASGSTDGTFGFDVKYMGSRSGNNNSYSLFMHNQTGTDVEAMTVLQDGKVGINNTSPSAPLDVSGNAEITGTLTAGEVSATTLDIGGTNITSTAAELNILDGVTATTAELNILDGVTATATEINKLDGVTATTTELNYVDVTTLGTVQASKAVTADSGGDVLFPDNEKLKIGTGGDLEIYHDGTNSIIRDDDGFLLHTGSGSKNVVVTGVGQFVSTKLKVSGSRTGTGGVISAIELVNRAGNTGVTDDGGSFDLEAWRVSSDNPDLLLRTAGTLTHRFSSTGNVSLGVADFNTISERLVVIGNILAKSSTGSILKLQTSDTTVADGDTIGAIEFSAPDEASGTDAVLTAASIVAEADATFAADNNQTDMVFKLGSSAAATEKMRLTHEGNLELSGDIELGHASDTTISRSSAGVVTIEGNTIITTGNSDTPTTTTSSSDADFVLVDDGGTMKKITPSNLGITSGSASKGFAVAMAIAL